MQKEIPSKQITSKILRNLLPGYRFTKDLASDGLRKLEMISDIRGFLDEVISVHAFWITRKNDGYTRSYTTLQEAIKNWDDPVWFN